MCAHICAYVYVCRSVFGLFMYVQVSLYYVCMYMFVHIISMHVLSVDIMYVCVFILCMYVRLCSHHVCMCVNIMNVCTFVFTLCMYVHVSAVTWTQQHATLGNIMLAPSVTTWFCFFGTISDDYQADFSGKKRSGGGKEKKRENEDLVNFGIYQAWPTTLMSILNCYRADFWLSLQKWMEGIFVFRLRFLCKTTL